MAKQESSRTYSDLLVFIPKFYFKRPWAWPFTTVNWLNHCFDFCENFKFFEFPRNFLIFIEPRKINRNRVVLW